MKTLTLLACVALLGACSYLDSNIINGQSFPEEASVYRCSEYNGSVTGRFTNTTAMVDGCQCVHMGPELPGVVTVKSGDNCSMTWRSNVSR